MRSGESELPGAKVIASGLGDLAAGRESAAALLVECARPRLERIGVLVPAASFSAAPSAEIRLYRLLRAKYPRDAYSRYNALLRLVTSYARALEHRRRLQSLA